MDRFFAHHRRAVLLLFALAAPAACNQIFGIDTGVEVSATDAGDAASFPPDSANPQDSTSPQDAAETSVPADAHPDSVSDGPACEAGLTMCAGGVCADLASSALNCGACGHSCNGAQCTAMACASYTIAKSPTTGNVAKLATDGAQVVWADTGNTAILQVPAVGGSSTTLASSSALYGAIGGELALANSTVAFVYTGNGTDFSGAPSVGLALEGQSQSGVGVIGGTNAISGVAMNGGATTVYYVSENGTQWDLATCPIKGKAANGACGGGPGFSGRFLTQLAADARYMVFDVTQSGTPSGPGSPGLYVYDSMTMASSQFSSDTSAQSLADDGTWAYWTDASGTTFDLSRVPEALPTSSLQTPATGLATPAFAVDGTYVYYQSGTTIVSKPAAGGSATTLANASAKVTQMAVGGGLLVWTDGSTIFGVVLPPP
jgi:hypothetical protein